MLNYISGELYKTFRRKYTKISLAVIALLCICGNALVRMTFSIAGRMDSSYPFYLGVMLMPMCFAILTLVVDAVFSDEYKYGTLKNPISFGISRGKMYFGKLIVEIVLMLVIVAWILVAYTASALVFSQLGAHDPIKWQAISLFLQKTALSLPLWLGMLGILNMLVFAFRSNALFGMSAMLVFSFPGPVLGMLASLRPWLEAIYKLTISRQFSLLTGGAGFVIGGPGPAARPVQPEIIPWCILVGLSWFAVSSIAGYLLFRRREIK